MKCLYILQIMPLSVAPFATTSIHSVACLFFMVSFAVQKLVHLIRSIGLYMSLCLLPWENDLRKHLYG